MAKTVFKKIPSRKFHLFCFSSTHENNEHCHIVRCFKYINSKLSKCNMLICKNYYIFDCKVDLPEIKGNHRKFRTLVSSYIGKKLPKCIECSVIVKAYVNILFFSLYIIQNNSTNKYFECAYYLCI